MDFKSYLASSDEESEDDQERIMKYKSLLSGGDVQDDNNVNEDGNNDDFGADADGLADNGSDDDVDMEISFTPGLSEAASSHLKEKEVRAWYPLFLKFLITFIQKQANETVFEAEQRKRREKKKAKALAKANDDSSSGN